MKRIALFLSLSVFAFASSGCIKLPETGKSAFIITSPAQEAQLGTDGYKEVLAKAKINQDPRLNQILQRVGKRIAQASGHRDYKWEFTLIDSPEKNAWCMPGGKVAFYTGILPDLKNEAGMAAVMGHEVAHATLRHAGQRITQQMAVQMGLSAADLTMKNAAYKSQLMTLLGAGATVGVLLPFSREDERESDEVGLRYMAKAGYDPREAVEFWQRFSKSAGGAPPEFLSTHPASSSRIEDLRARLPEATRLYDRAHVKSGAGEVL